MKQKIISSEEYSHFPFTPSSSYFINNFSRLLDSSGWLIPNVPVNKSVLSLVKTLQTKFQQQLPATLFDDLGHGGLGHIMFFKKENEEHDLIRGKRGEIIMFESPNLLIARISYGRSFGEKKRDWNFSNYNRMHLSVLATKNFRPVDGTSPLIRENVYFTIRWDGHNKPSGTIPFDNQTSLIGTKTKFGGIKGFDPRRMTFYQSEEMDVERMRCSMSIDEYCSYYPMAKKELNVNNIFFDCTTRKNLEEDPFDYYFKNSLHKIDTIPVVGYGPVLKMLSNYGDLNENDLDFLISSTPEQGIEYFANKVIPAVEKYAFSNSN